VVDMLTFNDVTYPYFCCPDCDLFVCLFVYMLCVLLLWCVVVVVVVVVCFCRFCCCYFCLGG
jgi:hypothetical protein